MDTLPNPLPIGIVGLSNVDGPADVIAESSGIPLDATFPDLVQLMERREQIEPLVLFRATQEHCETLLDGLRQRFVDLARECTDACRGSVELCRGCLCARADETIAKVIPTVQKCKGKITKQAQERFGLTARVVTQLGCEIPPPAIIQSILSGLSPADLFASQSNVVVSGNGGGGIPGQLGTPTPPGPPTSFNCPDGQHFEFDEAGNPHCVPDITPPPPDTGGGCPPGQHPAGLGDDGQPFCAPDDIGGGPGGGPGGSPGLPGGPGGPPVGPPIGPPPPLPPGGPPPPFPPSGPPIIVDGQCCWPREPATLLGCVDVTAGRPRRYWLVVSPDDCAHGRACIYVGDDPPPASAGTLAGGPYPDYYAAYNNASIGIPICGPPAGPPPVSTGCAMHCVNALNSYPGEGPGSAPALRPGWHGAQPYTVDRGATTGCLTLPIQYDPATLPAGWREVASALPGIYTPQYQDAIGQWVDAVIDNTTDCKWVVTDPAHPPPPPTTPPPTTQQLTSCDVARLPELHKSIQSNTTPFEGIGTSGQPPEQPGFFDTIFSFLNPFQQLKDIVKTIYATVTEGAATQLEHSPCNAASFLGYATEGILINVFGGWFGAVPDAVKVSNQYLQNMACQYLLPSGPELHAIRARNFINEDEWRAGLAANGLCLPWQEKILEAGQTWPNVNESIALQRRRLIDGDTWFNYMRRAGVKDPETANQFYQLTEYIPGPGDLIRLMLRDVFDPAVSEPEQLGDEFTDKFQGQLKDWAAAQGIPESVMLALWKAHWIYPSNTQLFEMFHRLPEDGTVPGTDTPYTAVTIDDVLRVLGINDVSPVWRARLAAIAYRRPMRREIAKLYETGVYDDEDVREAFGKLGYAPEDSTGLSEYVKRDSAERKAKFEGTTTRAETIALFTSDGLTYQTALDMLREAGVNEFAAPKLLETADTKRSARIRADNIRTLKRRFMIGDMDTGEVIRKLTDYGVAEERIEVITGNWREQLSLKRKEPALGALCDWVQRGYITSGDYVRRLGNLGYSPDDAIHFLMGCQAKLNEKVIKEVEKAAREAAAQRKRDAACRTNPKPYCSPRRTFAHTVRTTQTNGKPPETTATDTDSTTSG